MADNLENWFKQNRDAFDDAEPASGHLERFERKLHGAAPIRRNLFMSPFFRMAAVLVMGFMLGYLYYTNDSAGRNRMASDQGIGQASMDISSISPELAEAEVFFDRMIQQKLTDLSGYKEKDSALYHQVVEQLEGLETAYNDLRSELVKVIVCSLKDLKPHTMTFARNW